MSSTMTGASTNIKLRSPPITLSQHSKSQTKNTTSVQMTFVTVQKRDIPLQHENQDRNQQTGGVAFQGHASLKSGSYHSSKEQNQNLSRDQSPIKKNWRCIVCKMWNVGCNRKCNIFCINDLNAKLQQKQPHNPQHQNKGGRY